MTPDKSHDFIHMVDGSLDVSAWLRKDKQKMTDWCEAVISGNVEAVAQLLTTYPALINAVTDEGCTAIHHAASEGHEKIMDLLLKMSSIRINAFTSEEGLTALHCAASMGHDKIVAQLLTASPTLIHAVTDLGCTALHCAAQKGHEAIIAQLLAVNPTLIDATTNGGWTALHEAASKGQEKIVAQLLAVKPTLIFAITNDEHTALHIAAHYGHDKVVTQLLTACPTLVDAVTSAHMTALHCAITEGHESTAELLLAAHPQSIHAIDGAGNTALHLALQTDASSPEFIAELLNRDPHALHCVNQDAETPFLFAVAIDDDSGIALLQWKLCFDDIVSAFEKCQKSHVNRFRPVMEAQCEALLSSLNQDVVRTVHEYLGFESIRQPCRKKAKMIE